MKSHFLGIAYTEKSPYLCTDKVLANVHIKYLFSYYEYGAVAMTTPLSLFLLYKHIRSLLFIITIRIFLKQLVEFAIYI